MKVKVEHVEYSPNKFVYCVYKTKKNMWYDFITGDWWLLDEEFFVNTYTPDEIAKKLAIEHANHLIRPKEEPKPLNLKREIIYEIETKDGI